MRIEILHELSLLEEQKQIKILYAVESGSRAWGFASTNSDWDVRFIYIHKTDWYLSIGDKKDNIEKILPNEIDLAGWEIRKALNLFKKSNPPMLEWLRSPLIYKETYSTAQELRQLSAEYFNPKSCLYHYLHMAKGNFKMYLQKETVRVKKYFYVLRPILACRWIERTNDMAPMEFKILMDTQIEDQKLKSEIENLLKRKIKGDELNDEPRIQILNDFIQEQINYYSDFLEKFEFSNKPKIKKLDDLFIRNLIEVNGSKI
ncbi:MAG: nucleotidyltransferase domain-containing protein [Bacteroidia bacterium]